MKTLSIRNGDLALAPGGFAMVSGTAKVKQDMGVAVREPIGCDRFHPNWGSVLGDLAGDFMSADVEGRIVAEVNRLVRNYAAIQDDLLAADYGAGRTPRYGTDEIVADVRSIDVRRREDTLYVRVEIATHAGTRTSLVTSVGA